MKLSSQLLCGLLSLGLAFRALAQDQSSVDTEIDKEYSGSSDSKTLTVTVKISNKDATDLKNVTMKFAIVTSTLGAAPAGSDKTYDSAHHRLFSVESLVTKDNLVIPTGQTLEVPLDPVALKSTPVPGDKPGEKTGATAPAKVEGFVVELLKDGKSFYILPSTENIHLLAAYQVKTGAGGGVASDQSSSMDAQ